MSRAPQVSSLWWLGGPLLLALSCSHDAPRDNPLDPQLTPPVELQVVLDDTVGTATLTWTRYEGEAEFGEYRVLRSRLEEERPDTLAVRTEVGVTSYVDSTVHAGISYVYQVSVVNAEGFEAESEEVRPPELSLPSVRLWPPVFESSTASAKLKWTPYAGPRFAAYSVQRRTEGVEWKEVARIANLTVTDVVDEGLLANTAYSYRVDVVTTQGESLSSDEVVGGIHGFVESWPLDLEDDAFVRLYREGADGLTVLVATRTSVRLLLVDGHGEVLEEQTLLDLPHAYIEPQSVTTVVMGGTRRVLSLRTGDDATVLEYNLEGEPVTQEYPLFVDGFADPLGELAVTGGAITMYSRSGGSRGLAVVSYDNIRLWVEGQKVFDEGFDAGTTESWGRETLTVEDGWGHATAGDLLSIVFDDVWRSVRLEADVVLRGGIAGVALGSTSLGGQTLRPSSRFELRLSATSSVSVLWGRADVEGHRTGVNETELLTFQIVRGLPYHVGLKLADGRFSAWITPPYQVWTAELDDDSGWCNIVAVEDALAIVAGKERHTVDAADAARQQGDLPDEASEVHSWDLPVSTGTAIWLGYCLPERNQVLYGRSGTTIGGTVKWVDDVFGRTLGGLAGGESGEFLYPISFGVGPDGRLFVLDAGNGRIQVFTHNAEYLTQWGGEGSGEGQFDFGSGAWAGSFSGSICVDEEGYIYVADVGNKRIQRFSP